MALLFKHFGVIHVMTAQSVAPRRTIMTTFTITSDNNITAHGTAEEAAAVTGGIAGKGAVGNGERAAVESREVVVRGG